MLDVSPFINSEPCFVIFFFKTWWKSTTKKADNRQRSGSPKRKKKTPSRWRAIVYLAIITFRTRLLSTRVTTETIPNFKLDDFMYIIQYYIGILKTLHHIFSFVETVSPMSVLRFMSDIETITIHTFSRTKTNTILFITILSVVTNGDWRQINWIYNTQILCEDNGERQES